MTKFKGPFGLIRELLKYGNHIQSIHFYRQTGILEMVLAGRVVIPIPEITEGMKKSGYLPKIFYNSVDLELTDIAGDLQSEMHDEEDVPGHIRTHLLLKDTEPPLENSGKSDIQALITEPLKAEFEAAMRDAACSNCEVKTEGEDEDDITDE